MTTHFFSISAGLAEKVFMTRRSVTTGEHVSLRAAHTPAARLRSTPSSIYLRSLNHLSLWFYSTSPVSRRNRISRGRVSHGLRLAVRPNGDLAGGEPLAELEQPRLGDQAAGRGPAQKIDVEVDGHGQRDRTDRGKHRHIHGKVRKRHHGGPGNRTARPYRDLTERLPHPAAALPYRFDYKAALGMENLRKLGEEKALDLLDCHHHRHPPPSRLAKELDDCRRMKKIGGRSAHIRRGTRGSRWAHFRINGGAHAPHCGWDASPDLSRLAELLAQLVLRPHQGPLTGRGQALTGTIDVEGEHGKRGAKGTAFSTPASFSRPLQRRRDPLGIA